VIRPEVTARHAVALAAVGRLLVTRAVKPVYLGGGSVKRVSAISFLAFGVPCVGTSLWSVGATV